MLRPASSNSFRTSRVESSDSETLATPERNPVNLTLTRDSRVLAETPSPPVAHAIGVLCRDLSRALAPTHDAGSSIRLVEVTGVPEESFELLVDGDELVLRAGDDLGFVYGLYHVSEALLGVPAFWFWNSHEPIVRATIDVDAAYHHASEPATVRLRGWFVNDEVLLNTWSIDGDAAAPWAMVFEALLRSGGNLVIPGTDYGSVHKHIDLATEMGLHIAQHHAEPLGAEMFIRAHPGLTPSYAEHPELFQGLWAASIAANRHHKMVWNLGFRGQGDKPFWIDDPTFDTAESRGGLISEVIRLQYAMLNEAIPGAAACVYLYGETLELFRAGVLDLPDDVVKIWADNGYGRMVSRRQDNDNPRIPAFADPTDTGGNGIYYHVSFYDLQAANHITMLPNSAEQIEAELRATLDHGMNDLWVVNCSNVKPHVYMLDLVANLWNNGSVDVAAHRLTYAATYYGADAADIVASSLVGYADAAVRFGPEWDEHAGEQFANHVPRVLVTQYLKNHHERADEVRWLTTAPDLRGQVEAAEQLFAAGVQTYTALNRDNSAAAATLSAAACELFDDTLTAQTRVHLHGYRGAEFATRALVAALDEEWESAFLFADRARREYVLAYDALRSRERGLWIGFHQNDSLTDIEQSAWVMEGLMRYLRIVGDGPYFYEWQRRYLYAPKDAEVLLVLRLEKTVGDIELAQLMESRWGR
jgi:hypothetical protein